MKIRKFAAIDIGSNAVRLLIKRIIEDENVPPHFKKETLVRIPIRLGAEVFTHGLISPEHMKRMQDTMQVFKSVMELHQVDRYKACGTSAMREAKNAQALVDLVAQQTGIPIEVIDGNHEAVYIATTDLHKFIKPDKTYIYVDVGGGSTEFTIYAKGRALVSQSFDLGTIRLLNKVVHEKEWEAAEAWVRKHTAPYKEVKMIGSGGNINYIKKTSGKKRKKPLKLDYLTAYYHRLIAMSFEERVVQLRMNLDRADVIIPATKIFLLAMKWSGAEKIYVPKIGLADGIINYMYNQEKEREAQKY